MDRMVRVNELLKREIGNLFERLVCPETSCLITVTGVKTAPDLRNAQVYVSFLGNFEQKKAATKVIFARRLDIQKEVAKNVTLKYTPKLEFRLDETAETADNIMQILTDLEDENDA